MYNTYQEFNTEKEKCRQCPVGNIYNKVVLSTGNLINPTYMAIGEAPGRDEVTYGQPFVGKAGVVIRKAFSKNNLTTINTCITNTIPCRPQDNQFPSDSNLVNKCVSMWLLNEIILLKPRFILLIGSTPAKYLLNSDQPISKIRGQVFDQLNVVPSSGEDSFEDKFNLPILCIPTFHPSYIIRNEHTELGRIITPQFESDIEQFANLPNSGRAINPTF